MNHIIQKQRIEFELKPRYDVFSMQQQMNEYYHQEILPVLTGIFDQLAGENEMLKIDKLVIDLGLIRTRETGSGFSIDNLPDVLTRQIHAIIKEKQMQAGGSPGSAGSKGVVSVPLIVHASEQWLHYIRTGTILWNVLDTGPSWKLQVLEGFATEFTLVTRLREIIRSDEKAVKRIIRDHAEFFLVKLIEVLTASGQSHLPELIRELQLFKEAVNSGRKRVHHLRQQAKSSSEMWKRVLSLFAENGSGISSMDIAEKIIRADHQNGAIKSIDQLLIQRDFRILQPLIVKLTGNSRTDSTGKTNRKKSGINQEEAPGPGKDNLSQNNNSTGDTQIVQAGDRSKSEQRDDKLQQEKTEAPEAFLSPAEQIPEEGIYVTHAGLILLHPFFRFLYKNLSLTENGRFIDREKQERAVLLLHYLASGNTESEDHQLVIPKIICSWPLDEPLGIDTTLAAQETGEADDLLRVAISQWSIIKNTSPDGLREGFLQRRGKVLSKNGHIHIQVEKNTIDVLLGHLPWNLGVVKLPWIENLLFVDWA